MKTLLDIGCGDILTKLDGYLSVGIDIAETNNPLIRQIDMIKEPERALHVFGEGSVDLVVCNDFLEHLPTYLPSGNPRIKLFNVIWRLLKRGGYFESKTPCLAKGCSFTEWAQDPTHQIPWTRVSFDYFSNKKAYIRLQELYGIESRFKIIQRKIQGCYIYVKMKK